MAIKIKQVPGLNVPESLFGVIVNAVAKAGESVGCAKALTINFRDKDYSAKAGGFHPVEVRLEKRGIGWELIYITDFSYQGRPDSELVKEIDVCFVIKRVYHMLVGWLSEREGKDLLTLFVANFVDYYNTGCYQVSITTD
ncbi:MAG TPA: DUF2787 domain-containing protein [Pseudoalteromonas sp.]|uniref:DUF2787 domain-containing protein n=1 Tax=marine sediment metagenome TaxID=412755 RepID=A0A0F9TE10_9ZZZZ|nr:MULTISPECIES: DUF2787 family protein [unclassified Pseudoalteromonas]MBB1297298.1 DUF2787 domain-containing protein [Pseudoalteromonas sp. SR41-7]MBB1346585.1 DUF2787 domain-containing protein [Pseudoalteromonas sp. SG45-2]PLT24059.1 DUF2787 domain-containing protein [Pseudoalteromonas sp. MelDa3]HDY93500.1 DUF2787 domain-containing protein [Pseudoalteromonas sp.]HDZ33872.1 DUF2787 domain-containing protein [Pseudoalteromonas sp.]